MRTERGRCKMNRRLFAALALGVLGTAGGSCAATPDSPADGQVTFASAEAAVQALVAALRSGDQADLQRILGPEGRELLDSGDAVADRNNAEAFLAAFDRHHELVVEAGPRTTLVVGEDDWAMPIPVVAVGGAWHFDTESGKEEILARRIGANELAVIEVCRAIVDAQYEYSESMRADSRGERVFAQRFLSSPGTRDGLYWERREGEPGSPLGPLVAEAVAEGYSNPPRAERPFHGYRYRMLTAQGPSAPGGARNYLNGGRMTGGFASIAWPAVYDSSGIMTFLVNDDGIVYQKDLGTDTERVVGTIESFDPGEGWEVVPE